MTRDYKKNHRRVGKIKRLREFSAGAMVGIVVAGGLTLYYMHARHDPARERPDVPSPAPSRLAPVNPDGRSTTAGTEKYDFYQMLPHFEVVVPEKDKEVKRDLPAAVKIDRPGVYVLQAGSYRNKADAERVRAQLAMQGVDAQIQRVAVDSDVWYRVRVGPITKLDELNRMRKKLQGAEIDALVIRVGD